MLLAIGTNTGVEKLLKLYKDVARISKTTLIFLFIVMPCFVHNVGVCNNFRTSFTLSYQKCPSIPGEMSFLVLDLETERIWP